MGKEEIKLDTNEDREAGKKVRTGEMTSVERSSWSRKTVALIISFGNIRSYSGTFLHDFVVVSFMSRGHNLSADFGQVHDGLIFAWALEFDLDELHLCRVQRNFE